MKIKLLAVFAVAAASILSEALPALGTHVPPPAGCRQIRGAETPLDHSDDVNVCRQDVFFHKAGTRLGNLAGVGQDTVPSWNTTRPAGTLQDSAGMYITLAAYDIFVGQDPTGRAIFRGSFTGTLDTLGFQVFMRAPVYENGGGAWPGVFYLSIDGEVVHDNFDTPAISMPLKVAGNVRRIDGAFVNMYDKMRDMGLDLSPTKQHTVEVSYVPWYFGDSHTVIFYDAAEAASGLLFNLEPQAMSGYTQIDLMVA